ncbi:DUF3182 family protein [Pseudoxanthomonas helianthi]|uniref:DUF3182 family protein n=1 Tax=Pseudoxanthomonas helianthi TaxID=1453541 RepID=A0A940X295_9GAMM|nr:DUF3182 family protein [Pseudoxanthomonas helianthi]MBP3983404.1 DUF3182 family protein [Pseudoxanthomonas helianthi]
MNPGNAIGEQTDLDDGDGTGIASPARLRRLAIVWSETEPCASHEIVTLRFAAARLAALLGLEYDDAQAGAGEGDATYYLPMFTLTREEADARGIVMESQLWGGIVPHGFVATKLVSHPPWGRPEAMPEGWKHIAGIEKYTLPGYSVFARDDAWQAGKALLQDGAVRLKWPFARGGGGQAMVRDQHELSAWLDAANDSLFPGGLVVERHLESAKTYSVGSSSLPGYDIAYWGEQHNVLDPSGSEVYGGSALTVVRGSFPSALAAGSDVVRAIVAANAYDRLVRGAYGVVASRRNYDVIVGVDARGDRHLGVLEQSWRFGGASMAEVFALEWFSRNPGSNSVAAETGESYGDEPLPEGAVLYCHGDAESPRKYARIIPYGC